MPADERTEALLDLDPRSVAVVLVDFQRDFCVGSGPVPYKTTSGNAHAAERANLFAAQAAEFGVRTIYSQQVLDLDRLTWRQRRWEESSRLCRLGSAGAELYLPPVPGSRLEVKHRFDVWQSTEFTDLLADWGIDGLVIGGVELQCCLLYAVLGADERGYHYTVPQDLASGLDRCEQTSNRDVRSYLAHVHPNPASADELLAGWRARQRSPRPTRR